MRIATLLPSATDIIISLGLINNLVGVSHECSDIPKKIQRLTTSSIKSSDFSNEIHRNIQDILKNSLSVYEVKFDLLKRLNPDFIITQSQCNVCAVSFEQVKAGLCKLMDTQPKLIDLKPTRFKDVCNDILRVGNYLGVKEKSESLVKQINKQINNIQQKLSNVKKKNVLCIEWLEPIMTAGNWIPDLLNYVGANDLILEGGTKSSFINSEKIPLKDVDLVIFMPCGFKIEKTKSEIKRLNLREVFYGKDMYVVNGDKYFNRPGPSLLESVKILSEILHPEIFGQRPKKTRWEKL